MSIFGSKLEYENVRLGGLRAPGPWMWVAGLLAAGILLFNISPRGLVLVAAVGVVALVVAGFASDHEEGPARSRRRLSKVQLQNAREQTAAPKPRASLEQLRQAKATAQHAPAQPDRTAQPSRTWRQHRDTSRALLLGLFAAWACTTGIALSALFRSLGPSWDRQTKGMSEGTWLVLALFGVSFVAFVPLASWIESRVMRAQRARHQRPETKSAPQIQE